MTCEHKWTLDDAVAQHDSETQLWYGCTECFATRFVVLDATRTNEWLKFVTTDRIQGEHEWKPHTTVAEVLLSCTCCVYPSPMDGREGGCYCCPCELHDEDKEEE